MAARLGNVIYWLCSGISFLVALVAAFVIWNPGLEAPFWVPIYVVTALVIWGVGRAARYVLSNR